MPETRGEVTAVTPYASIEKIDAATEGDPSRGVLLQARLLWGGDTISVRHLAPRDEMRIRDLALDVPGGAEICIAGRDAGGRFVLRLPNGAIVPPGCRMKLRVGRATLELSLVADDALKVPRALLDRRVAWGIFAAAALHLTVLALLAHGRAPDGATEEAARVEMQRMVAAAEERAFGELAAARENPRDETPGAAAASNAEAAIAGNPAKTSDLAARARVTRGENRRAIEGASNPAPSAQSAREEAATFGLITLINADREGARGGSSVFAAESGPSAMGNIFGQTIDDAAGLGGLALSGAGEGGGGKAGGVALGAIGTIGRAGGTAANGQGFGKGHCGECDKRAEHRPFVWVMRQEGGVSVNGRLPPESIQRIVRQSFGRLRACYERGLQRNPDLEGRIAVKFVIDREGSVAMASAAERTLDDASVATCVVKAYEAMTFPKPEGGIVTVVYPVVFTRTSP